MDAEPARVTIQGHYRDRLTDGDGRLLTDSGWRKNLIVLRCRVLLAAFLHNEAGALGIQSLQLGRGDPSWDATPPAAADPATTTQLVDPAPVTVPLAGLTIQYLNSTDGVVATPTNRVQVTVTLGPDQPAAGPQPFPLREFGLFGQLGGNPFMIDYIRHPLIEKDSTATLERKVRLIL